jgi:N-acetylmuramic acid 6-phosphate etherase
MDEPFNLGHLMTEQMNPASVDLDTLPTAEMLEVFNREDRKVAEAVAREIPRIAQAVDSIAERLGKGGRLFYTGAGTSGRLGVLDASECPPTFNVPPDLVVGIIAGGDKALRSAVEGAEDSPELGAADLAAAGFSARDAVVGIAASGRTPYVLGAMRHARAVGGLAVGLSCAPDAELSRNVDIAIEAVPGPEVIAGSTRLKAGTATKLVLNMISSGVMIRLGLVFSNLMINVQPSNAKLVDRAQRILMTLLGCGRERAAELLESGGRNVRTALVMGKLNVTRQEAERRLAAAGGGVRQVLGAPPNEGN